MPPRKLRLRSNTCPRDRKLTRPAAALLALSPAAALQDPLPTGPTQGTAGSHPLAAHCHSQSCTKALVAVERCAWSSIRQPICSAARPGTAACCPLPRPREVAAFFQVRTSLCPHRTLSPPLHESCSIDADPQASCNRTGAMSSQLGYPRATRPTSTIGLVEGVPLEGGLFVCYYS